jgi:ATP-binding cassette subfamily D (ALD) long-chain fatty acid import protein
MQVSVAKLQQLAPKIAILSTISYFIYSRVKSSKQKQSTSSVVTNEDDGKGPIKLNKNVLKVGVDAKFWKQLKYILKICVPSWRSGTVGILALHTTFLILRTYLTVVVARIDGALVKELVLLPDSYDLLLIGCW